MPLLTILATYLFWSARLKPHNEDTERFREYLAVVPSVSYNSIEADLMWRHIQASQSAPAQDEVTTEDKEILTATAVINDSYSDLSKELNLYLYQLAQQYSGNLYVGDIHLSPLLVLAEANLEGGRVDTSETFSALASTSVYDFNSVEELAALNVTDCLRSEEIWRRMSSEYYTRDRGALQCNPNYGANDLSYGPSEASLLAEYTQVNGVPDYGTQKDAVGNKFTVQDWIDYARVKAGDRFNPESVVRMFSDEKMNTEIPGILRAFPDVQNEWQVYCIMAYCHWCGSGYLTMDRSQPYAGFKTVALSDEYCRDLAQPAVIETLYSICVQDIQDARSQGRNPVSHLDKNTGYVVFDKLVSLGLLKDWDYYFRHLVNSSGWDQGDTACTYPLGLMYGVIQMSLLYSGY